MGFFLVDFLFSFVCDKLLCVSGLFMWMLVIQRIVVLPRFNFYYLFFFLWERCDLECVMVVSMINIRVNRVQILACLVLIAKGARFL